MKNPARNFSRRKARIEILPLIDVIFLLLCFFVYASMSMVFQKGINLNLASAVTGLDQGINQETVVVSIDKSNQLFWNQDKLPNWNILEKKIKSLTIKNPHLIIINADQETNHGSVMKALDLFQKNEIFNISLSIHPVKE